MIRIQELEQRHAKTESAVDRYGRGFNVGLLKPSQRNKILELAGDANAELRLRLILVASVRSVLDSETGQPTPFPFPQDRTTLDANCDLFDDAGIDAILEAYGKLNADQVNISQDDIAKN